MKRFSSYGPPSPRSEFMVQRPALVQQISGQLIGNLEEKGHYFTVFAPRQRGKTTTLRSVVEHIQQQYPEQFHVGMAILHLVQDLRSEMTLILNHRLKVEAPTFQTWDEVRVFFSKAGPLKKPVILILDEFDALPQSTLEETISFFRSCYHERNDNWLHGVALIGVHSSLGKLEGRTSPFNVQRSVNIPNLTREEVFDLYAQYTAESGQPIEPEGVERIYELFRGQPGLTCWFGELLTEKYNTVQPPPWERKEEPPSGGYPLITRAQVERVVNLGQYSEININIRNLLSKGLEHKDFLRDLFVRHDVRFDLNKPDLQWLYLNGILVGESDPTDTGETVCAFASPFVQRCLFSAFGQALNHSYGEAQLITLEEAPSLRDVLLSLDVPRLLSLYRHFLVRQVAKGDAPWKEQPARSDARAFEAIGHFNLYAWLYGVSKGAFSVIPEFPTGNGTADLLLTNRARGQEEVLEVKSFTSTTELEHAVGQVARYARKLKRSKAYLVVMADASAYTYLSQKPGSFLEQGIAITLEVIPWGFVPGPVAGRGGAGEGVGLASSIGRSSSGEGGDSSSAAVGLPVRERVALEAMMKPVLTEEAALQLWLQLDHGLEELKTQVPGLIFSQLVQKSIRAGRLGELLVLVELHFPELETHPLLAKLRAQFPG